MYLPGVDNRGQFDEDVHQHDWVKAVNIPMYMLIGGLNQVFLPAGGIKTQQMLKVLSLES